MLTCMRCDCSIKFASKPPLIPIWGLNIPAGGPLDAPHPAGSVPLCGRSGVATLHMLPGQVLPDRPRTWIHACLLAMLPPDNLTGVLCQGGKIQSLRLYDTWIRTTSLPSIIQWLCYMRIVARCTSMLQRRCRRTCGLCLRRSQAELSIQRARRGADEQSGDGLQHCAPTQISARTTRLHSRALQAV